MSKGDSLYQITNEVHGVANVSLQGESRNICVATITLTHLKNVLFGEVHWDQRQVK